MKYRPDIDVLRSIAVLGVVFFHAGFHTALGGYVGVDVFFVISGYLITRKIEEEIALGVFSFRNFYVNRARRLFPALFVTVLVTFFLSSLLLAADHFTQFAQSAVWTALSASNIFFWIDSGYWAADNRLKPLLHTWSLSVEEQFYLFWPLALYFLSKFANKFVPTALALTGALSFIGAAAYFKIDQDAVFFLTPFRVFEFVVGALLVWLTTINQPTPPAVNTREISTANDKLGNIPPDAHKREMLYQHDVGVARMRRMLAQQVKDQLAAEAMATVRTAV